MKFCLFFSALAALILISGASNAANPNSELSQPALRAVSTPLNDTKSLLDPFIKALLNTLIQIMGVGIPWLGIPAMDPLNTPDVFLNLTDPRLKVKGAITNVQTTGLGSLRVAHVETNLLQLTAVIGFELPELSIKGDYDIDGTAALIFPIYGKGPFEIKISGLKLGGGSKLTMQGPYLQFKDSHYEIDIDNFNVKFEGFLDGGDLGDTMIEIVNAIGLNVFDLIEPAIHDSLVKAIEEFVNSKLREKTLEDILAGNAVAVVDDNSLQAPSPFADAGSYLDEVLANLREVMILNDLDRIVLPDQILKFSHKILGVTWHGEASIYNGLVKGLETIHRYGSANLNLENGDIVFDAELEINDGTLMAAMVVKFMNLGPTASITGTLKRVKLQIKCRIANGLDKVTLEKFNIANLGYLTIDVKGLGLVLNFLVEIVSEFLGNIVKGLVAAVLESSIKNLLNDIIDRTVFPPLLLAQYQTPLLLGSNLEKAF